jgi:hypothetical protein
MIAPDTNSLKSIRVFSITDTSLVDEEEWVKKYDGEYEVLSPSLIPVSLIEYVHPATAYAPRSHVQIHIDTEEEGFMMRINRLARADKDRRVKLHLINNPKRSKTTCRFGNMYVRCHYDYS